mmetsp:Transcript_9431/g.20067  ORF Transcript_9431/g.20067 Transcript_9431/m.20067 type:complete len:523 (-) Transcript_9431:244-1812(-)
MSRSALWRQEANLKEREKKADETLRAAIEEGRACHVKGIIPLVGPDDTFNIHPMLLQNIAKSPYFQKCCEKLTDWNTLVDEIYYEVKHMEPWTAGAGKVPSTAFCLLLRLFTLRCTEKQMALMLDHVDSPYIRCIGFLYLRYAADPYSLWSWFEPYLYDEGPVQIQQGKSDTTVGEYVRFLLGELEYYGTRLPRLPLAMERQFKVKLLQAERVEERAKGHLHDKAKMDYFQKVGSRIRALYGDEENPITWYDAVVDKVVLRDEETGELLPRPKFWVTFPEYGNSELVTLGEVDLMTGGREEPPGAARVGNIGSCERGEDRDRGRSYDRDFVGYETSDGRGFSDRDRGRSDRKYEVQRGYGDRRYRDSEFGRSGLDRVDYPMGGRRDDRDRSRSRSRERDAYSYGRDGRHPVRHGSSATEEEKKLLEEVLRREREKSAAKGKVYAARPATFKESLGSPGEGSRHDVGPERGSGWRPRGSGPQLKSEKAVVKEIKPAEKTKAQKTAAELAAIEEKKRKLMARYG